MKAYEIYKELRKNTYVTCQSNLKKHITKEKYPDIAVEKTRLAVWSMYQVYFNRPRPTDIRPKQLMKNWISTIAKNRDNSIADKFDKLYPYATGEAKWAGGNNNFYFYRCNFIALSVESFKEYSSNGKWSGLSYNYTLCFNPFKQTFEVIGGLLTVFNIKDRKSKAHECTWFEQARGKDVKKIEGYLVRNYHIKKSKSVDNLEKAIKAVTKIRNNAALKLWVNRINTREFTQKLNNTWVTINDSLKAGNCLPGTEAFRAQYQKDNNYGEVGAVLASELYKNYKENSYVLRAINYAMAR